jgi:hypothetical protein
MSSSSRPWKRALICGSKGLLFMVYSTAMHGYGRVYRSMMGPRQFTMQKNVEKSVFIINL